MVLGLSSIPAKADHRAVASGGVVLKLAPCVKPVASTDNAIDLLANPSGFDCSKNQTKWGPGDYWVRMDVSHDTPVAAQILRWTSVWQDGAEVSVGYADGSVETIAVPRKGSGRFVHIGAYYTLQLDRLKIARTILFRIEGSGNMRGILLGPTLSSSDVIATVDTMRSALYGGFAGLAIALLAYNLMMWRAMRETYLLAYCAMLLASMAYAVTSSGWLAHLVPEIDNNLRLRFNYLWLGVTGIAAMWFVRQFLGDRLIGSRMALASAIAMGGVAGASLAFFLFAPWQIGLLDRLYFLSFGPLFLIAAGMFMLGWRRGQPVDRLFVIAWMLPLFSNSVRLLHGFGLVGQGFWVDNATLVAMSVEALVSSLIITHRIRYMRDDRDAARADEAAARALADTDELTGLLNRRALMRAVCPDAAAAGHYRLILIDIDHFKAINDSVGHTAGDAVLQKVAGVIRAALRPDVIAARIGGEEFALLFPTGNVDRRYYSSLLSRIRSLPPVGGQRVTISMGAANGWLGGSEGEWLALYRAADSALYEAKNSGRNRLIVAPRYRDMASAA